MAILKVGRIGHPVVRAVARDVDPAAIGDATMQRLIDDMVETMHEYDGVGVAAPQVHVGLRLAVIEVLAADQRSQAAIPLTVLINPKITPLTDEVVRAYEGCLSVPDLRGVVPRITKLRLDALDREGKPWSVEASGFFARVIQHECDHLDGRVYLDRMENLRSLTFLQEFDRFVLRHEDEDDDDDDEGEAQP